MRGMWKVFACGLVLSLHMNTALAQMMVNADERIQDNVLWTLQGQGAQMKRQLDFVSGEYLKNIESVELRLAELERLFAEFPNELFNEKGKYYERLQKAAAEGPKGWAKALADLGTDLRTKIQANADAIKNHEDRIKALEDDKPKQKKKDAEQDKRLAKAEERAELVGLGFSALGALTSGEHDLVVGAGVGLTLRLRPWGTDGASWQPELVALLGGGFYNDDNGGSTVRTTVLVGLFSARFHEIVGLTGGLQLEFDLSDQFEDAGSTAGGYLGPRFFLGEHAELELAGSVLSRNLTIRTDTTMMGEDSGSEYEQRDGTDFGGFVRFNYMF